MLENESQWYDELVKMMETLDELGDERDPNYYGDDDTTVACDDADFDEFDGNF